MEKDKTGTNNMMTMYNLSEMVGKLGRGKSLQVDEFSIYILKKGKAQNHTLSFSKDADFYKEGKVFLSIGENTMTGELFLIFTESFTGKEVELKTHDNTIRVATSAKKVVQFICRKLEIETSNRVNKVFKFSKNLSKVDGILTHKIIGEV